MCVDDSCSQVEKKGIAKDRVNEESVSKASESSLTPTSKRSRKMDGTKRSVSDGSFLYYKLVPAVLVILLITLIGTLTIVLLSILGVIPGG